MKSVNFFKHFRELYIVSLLIFLFSPAFAQKKGKEPTLYGFGVLYNFQTNGAAIDLRAKIPVYKNTYVIPRISYFPALNNIHEFYLGADVDYHVYRYKRIIPYVYLGGFYNNWINHAEFVSKKAKKNNFVFEGGVGTVFDFGCLNPFLEYRYDTKWKEGSLEAGLLLRFGQCFNKKKKIRCPAFS